MAQAQDRRVITYPDGSTETYPAEMPVEELKQIVLREHMRRSPTPTPPPRPEGTMQRAARFAWDTNPLASALGPLLGVKNPADYVGEDGFDTKGMGTDVLRAASMASALIPSPYQPVGLAAKLAPVAARAAVGILPNVAATAIEGGDVGREAILQSLIEGTGETLSRVPLRPAASAAGVITGPFNAARRRGPQAYARETEAFAKEAARDPFGIGFLPGGRRAPLQKAKEQTFKGLEERLLEMDLLTHRPRGTTPVPPTGVSPGFPASRASGPLYAPVPSRVDPAQLQLPSGPAARPQLGAPPERLALGAGDRALVGDEAMIPFEGMRRPDYRGPGTRYGAMDFPAPPDAPRITVEGLPYQPDPEQLGAFTRRPGAAPAGTAPPGRGFNLAEIMMEEVEKMGQGVRRSSVRPIAGQRNTYREGADLIAETLSRGQNTSGTLSLADQEAMRDALKDVLEAKLATNRTGANIGLDENVAKLSRMLGYDPFNMMPSEAYPIISQMGAQSQHLMDLAKSGERLPSEGVSRLMGNIHSASRKALYSLDDGAKKGNRLRDHAERYADQTAMQRYNQDIRRDSGIYAIRGASAAGVTVPLAAFGMMDPGTAFALSGLAPFALEPAAVYTALGLGPKMAGKFGPAALRRLRFETPEDGDEE